MIATTRTGMIYAEYIVEYQRILRINWNSVQDPKSPQKSWQAGFWLAWHSSLPDMGDTLVNADWFWKSLVIEICTKLLIISFCMKYVFLPKKNVFGTALLSFFYHNSLEASFILIWVWHSSAPACFRILLPSSVLVPAMLDWVNFNITCLPTPHTTNLTGIVPKATKSAAYS